MRATGRGWPAAPIVAAIIDARPGRTE